MTLSLGIPALTSAAPTTPTPAPRTAPSSAPGEPTDQGTEHDHVTDARDEKEARTDKPAHIPPQKAPNFPQSFMRSSALKKPIACSSVC
jgi:hypothetical protein